jgi:hypothetical protein
LCGNDPLTGFDFSHRRGWIVQRMKTLSGIFAIDLCAYAVMSNHYHVVLRVNVDLNPIRAAIAATPEQSHYTSIKERIDDPDAPQLMAFSDSSDTQHRIPFPLQDYVELVDWSGRAILSGKKGYIPSDTPPILVRLGMVPGNLLDYLQTKPGTFNCALGPVSRVRLMAHSLGLSFIRGISLAKVLCPEPN